MITTIKDFKILNENHYYVTIAKDREHLIQLI